LDAAGIRVAVVYSTFNEDITAGLLSGALGWLDEAGAAYATTSVRGAFELPVLARHAAAAGYDAVVALGAVVRGDTDHYDHIANRTSEGLMRVALDTGIPVAFGVLTADTVEQALERSASGPMNKGREAAAAAVQAVLAMGALDRPPESG
jgi:6,7-dimethyl-8-ribityllumazine synthase